MQIRTERGDDAAAIRALTTEAFEGHPHSSGTEAKIVDALRAADALSLSLVALENDGLVGHVAFSAVTIGDRGKGWYGLGPVSVRPARQGSGIGRALIVEGLERLRLLGASGVVLIGDPAYYARFGFIPASAAGYGDVPPDYVQFLAFGDAIPEGEIVFHASFDAA